ncbi:MAG TPA: fasciclin domain-containing protein [Flexivirga sp.]|uniref:fasciclin domain-containing protein n=1 Tax=Flexivirga sp. TaxID=1962927 RepID=UPI002C6CB068|nr:fasciclin domain-containing protein [Flexivirga sp.]HWC21502.1 fasciclin domain-containing protein [Flexivirga sp.]
MKSRLTLSLGTAAVLAASLSACGSSGSSGAGGSSAAGSSMASSMASSSAMKSSGGDSSMGGGAANASKPFGPACSTVPKSGKGSFSGMAQDPVATAASNNPALSTLVTAVKKAGLVDTLNSAPALTVFAPANSAFAKLPKAQLNAVLADKAKLSTLLTGHVVKGRLTPKQLSGDHKSLAGTTIKVSGSGDKFTVDGNSKVVCGNVQTSNATVYIVDTVLMGK